MEHLNRRFFLKTSATGIAVSLLPTMSTEVAAADSSVPQVQTSGDPKDATKRLAQYVLKAKFEDLPTNVVKETKRALVNYMGVTVGSCKHEAVEIAIQSLSAVSASKQATILGRKERFDALNAAFINGVGSHVFDFDDTHLVTNVHPSGPIASALLAYSEIKPVSGKDFLNAFYLGVEIMIRFANSTAPNHADIGWHVSGSVGSIGAAAAVGKLMGLSEQQMLWALGLGASQLVGFRDSFGSMNKSFNPGRAASNGLFAALLAQKNFTSSNGVIEGRVGWAQTVTTKIDYQELLGDLGSRFEIAKDTYKPFACGIVIHPAIDAAIQLRNQYQLKAEQIQSIKIKGNPMMLELCGKKTPQTGLEGKFSVFHSVATAIINGQAGEKQYSDAAVRDAKTITLRDKVDVTSDSKIPKKSADMVITLNDGRVLNKFIEDAIGSVANPMTDQQLEAKFTDLTEGLLSSAKNKSLIEACWNVDKLPNVAKLAKLSVA